MRTMPAVAFVVASMVVPRLSRADNPPPPAWYIYEGAVATVCAGFGAYFALRPGTHTQKNYDDVIAVSFAATGGLIAGTMLTVWLTTSTRVAVGPTSAGLTTSF